VFAQTVCLTLNLFFFACLAISLVLIRRINDQHFIWREVTVASMWAIAFMIVPAAGACRRLSPPRTLLSRMCCARAHVPPFDWVGVCCAVLCGFFVCW
jgi:hypothetical protein